jgi:hypothetical protein
MRRPPSPFARLDLQYGKRGQEEVAYRFGESGFVGSDSDGEWQVKWTGVERFLETDALFVLITGGLFHTVPKRALGDGQVSSLRDLLSKKLARR